jgi:murein L,D-transpeptidase YcbB/YkuD
MDSPPMAPLAVKPGGPQRAVEERIQQLRVNLERGRWILHNLESTFIVVNVAGYHSYYVKDGQMEWQGVHKWDDPSPDTELQGRDDLPGVQSTWTVPPTILAQDYLPFLKQDPGYVRRKGLKVIDRAGRAVEPWQIDWSRYSASYSPYLLRQDRPRNALGRVKFIFPNDHAVFLHDTPIRNCSTARRAPSAPVASGSKTL